MGWIENGPKIKWRHFFAHQQLPTKTEKVRFCFISLIFRIEFNHEGCSYIRAILPFKFAHCFGFIDQLKYRLSQEPCKFYLDSAMPACTSA